MAGNFWKSSHYEQWILDKQDLLRERAKDLKVLSEEDYQSLIVFFTDLMHTLACGNPLNCRQQMIATAAVYFKRFYARRSFYDVNPFCMVPTCLILASKVDEHGNMSTSKLAQALAVAYKPFMNVVNETHLVRVSMEVEFYLLEVMDCSLIVYHPYRPLLLLCQELKELKINTKEIINDAWMVVNDTYRTDACLLYAPHQIAIACIMLAGIINRKESDLVDFFAELSVDYDAVFDIIGLLEKGYEYHSQTVYNAYNQSRLQSLMDKMPKPPTSPTQSAS